MGKDPLDVLSWQGVMTCQLAGLLQQMLESEPSSRPCAAYVAAWLRDMYPDVLEQLQS